MKHKMGWKPKEFSRRKLSGEEEEWSEEKTIPTTMGRRNSFGGKV